jgi:hypothetical protein
MKSGNEIHRPRPVERNQRDDVLEPIGARPLDEITHAARLELEHGGRIAARKQPVGGSIVQWNRVQVEVRIRGIADTARRERAHALHRPIEDRERREAEEVELDEADLLDVVLVELRNHRVRSLRGIHRAEIGQLAGSDEHASRMHADVARQPFELFGEREQIGDLLLVALALGELRLHLARHLQRDGLARLERDQLRELIAEVVTEIEYAPHVAHHRARGHRAERRDLRHALRAVLLAHIFDDPVAACLAEVDVEIRHRNALRIEEALEQQVVAQRIEVRDAEAVRNQRPGAGTASRSDRNAVRLRPVDEVRDDQEIPREAHLDDHVDFEFEPLAIALLDAGALGRIGKERVHPRFEALERTRMEVVLERQSLRRGKLRQAALAELDRQVAALGDFHAVGERPRRIGRTAPPSRLVS